MAVKKFNWYYAGQKMNTTPFFAFDKKDAKRNIIQDIVIEEVEDGEN